VQEKGSEAYVKSVEAQIQAYQLENNKIPTIEELKTKQYIAVDEYPKGKPINISDDGTVSVGKS
ncbi:competence protein ComG, partial [Bacillus nitratireducens]|nr:competence protein ComG [Bacillus nitratireducens]